MIINDKRKGDGLGGYNAADLSGLLSVKANQIKLRIYWQMTYITKVINYLKTSFTQQDKRCFYNLSKKRDVSLVYQTYKTLQRLLNYYNFNIKLY